MRTFCARPAWRPALAPLLLSVAWVTMLAAPATPAMAQSGQTNRIKIEYVPPKNPAFQPIYDALKRTSSARKAAANFQPSFGCQWT